MGNGVSVFIFTQDWIPGVSHSQLVEKVNNCHLELVLDLIDEDNR